MARSSPKNYMAIFWMISFVMIQSSFAAPLEHWTVKIFNNMQSRQTLLLHCKSKDDDLGHQFLKIGEQFSWRFRENLWQTTLFWCYMQNQHTNFMSLEVFWPESHYFFSKRCDGGVCTWSVRDDGIYLKNASLNKFELQAKWKITP